MERDVQSPKDPESHEIPEGILPIRTGWVRARLMVPGLERLLGDPIGARIDDSFEVLKVRAAEAVKRISETAGEAAAEIRQRSRVLALGGLSSAVIGVIAVFIALYVPRFNFPAALIAISELAAVIAFRAFQRRLARDLIAAADLEIRFREPLEAAKTPEDIRKLVERIRRELEETVGLQMDLDDRERS